MSRNMVLMKDLIEVITMGPFGSDIKVDSFIDDGVPVLNGSNINAVKLTEESFRYVSDEKAKSLKKANTKRGDIVITHRGTLGQISYIPENSKYDNYIISQSQFRVTLKKDLVDPVYFTYYFHTSEGQKRLLSFKSHVGVPALAQATTNFRLLEFPSKSLKEQKQIAKVLSDLDAKIEINNKINQELEAMAKTLYDYWFVQFDFPDANGKPYKSSGGLMVFNEELKREIPVGWKSGVLSDIADITMGQSPSGSSYNEDGIGAVFYQGSTDFGSRFPTVRKYTTEPKRMAEENDILLSVRAPVGTLNQAMERCCIGRGLAALREKEGSISFLWSQMEYFKQIFDRRNTSGTTFGSITKDDLFSLKVCIPEKEILKEFKKIADPIHSKIIVNSKENQKLSELRDWLLPMLMNGQITVGGAEKEIESLGLVAEPATVYQTKENTISDLFEFINLDYEVATIVWFTEQKLNKSFGKKYIHKMFSNIEFLNTLPAIKELAFQENGWGMFSPAIAKTIENKKFIQFENIGYNQNVLKLNYKHLSAVGKWTKEEENKDFVSQINNMLSIYEDPLIDKNMDRIELLNTVLECIKVLKTYEFDAIYTKMKNWKMFEDSNKTKADKFKIEETRLMIELVLGLKIEK